jgi:uncharacterized Zn-binding protein involved in type VI secretion
MAAFRSRHRRGGRWWGLGTTLAVAALALVFTLTASGAKPQPGTPSGPYPVPTGPLGVLSGFEDNDGNMPPSASVPATTPAGTPAAPTNNGGYTVNFDYNSLAAHGLTWGAASTGSVISQVAAQQNGLGGWQVAGIAVPVGNAAGQESFAGGVKQDNNCPVVNSGGVQNKDDVRAAYLAVKTVSMTITPPGSAVPVTKDHTILNLVWERAPQQTTSASAHVAFEFNQNHFSGTGSSPCPGTNSDSLVNRAAGDLLLVYDFTGGSTAPPTLSLSRWVTGASDVCQVGSDSPTPNGCWGTFHELTTTSQGTATVGGTGGVSVPDAEANVDTGLTHLCQATATPTGCGPNEKDNQIGLTPDAGTNYQLPSSTTDCLAAGSTNPVGSGTTVGQCQPNNSADPPTSGGYALGTSEFGEVGVDLTAANVFSSSSCTSFGQAEVVSRSSGDSGSAQMEKLVGPINLTLSNCGEIKIIKRTDTGSATFPFLTNIKTKGGTSQSCTQTITTNTTVTSPPDSFSLTGNPTATTGDTEDCTNLLPSGSPYVVQEDTASAGGTFPSNYTFQKVVCTQTGGATISPDSSTTADTTSPGTETITLVADSVVTCTYTNTKNLNSPSATTAPSVIPQDSATVSGLDTSGAACSTSGCTADQKMTFSLYDNNTCSSASGGLKYQETTTVTDNTTYSTSNDGTPSSAGATDGFTITAVGPTTYYWQVHYDGDTRNNPFTTGCTAEQTTVTIVKKTS